jgi:hypothetical protein
VHTRVHFDKSREQTSNRARRPTDVQLLLSKANPWNPSNQGWRVRVKTHIQRSGTGRRGAVSSLWLYSWKQIDRFVSTNWITSCWPLSSAVCMFLPLDGKPEWFVVSRTEHVISAHQKGFLLIKVSSLERVLERPPWYYFMGWVSFELQIHFCKVCFHVSLQDPQRNWSQYSVSLASSCVHHVVTLPEEIPNEWFEVSTKFCEDQSPLV